MARKWKNIPNPTGKGGLQERPEDTKKGQIAASEKAAAEKEARIVSFREQQHLFKQNLINLALQGEKENTRLQATTAILGFVADGNVDKILEPSQEDEWGTVDDKLKKVSEAFIERSMKVSELEKEIERLKKLVKE